MEEQNFPREEKIRRILEQEIQDGENLAAEARRMIEYLLLEKKGYEPGDVEKNVLFDVELGQETAHSSVDLLVTVDGEKAMVIKCVAGSLSSRERQAVAAARLLNSPPVPIAVVADPVNAEVLDSMTGKVTGEGFGAIPIKEEMRKLLVEKEQKTLSPERIEKEKRVLLAFDAIQCSVPQGADGGVQLEEEKET